MNRRVWLLPGAALLCALLAAPCSAAGAAKSAAPDPRAWPAAYEQADVTLQSVLGKVKGANDAVEAAKTMRITATYVDGGLTGTHREVWRGEDYRVDETVGPFVSAYGRSAGQLWETNANGYTLLKRGIHKRGEANARALEKPDPGEDVKLLGRLHAPANVYVVRVAPPDGREERRFYDAASFQLVRRETKYLDHLVVTTYDDYRTINGVPFAFKTTSSDGRPENDEVVTLSDVQLGSPVEKGEVEIPGSRRIPVQLPEGVPSVRLPARIDPYGHIIVRLTINGRGLDFQLDSGADGIVIDRGIAGQLGLKTYGKWKNTVAGTFTSSQAVVPKIDIGPVTMTDVVVQALPFTSQNDWSTKIVGLLGYDFIAGAVVKIDYAKGTVDAIPSYLFEVPPNAVVLDAVLDDGVPMVSMKMNDAVGDRFIIDTGADSVIAFSGFAKRNAAALDDHSPKHIISRAFNFVLAEGVGGNIAMHATILAKMQLGNVVYHDYLAFVMQDDQPSFEGEDSDGLAGATILRAFDVYLDYANSRVVLVPNKYTHPMTPEQKS